MSAKESINVILPTCDLRKRVLFEKLVPPEITPSSSQEAVICFLTNPGDAEYFATCFLDYVDGWVCDLCDERQEHYLQIHGDGWRLTLECLLNEFHAEYTALTKELFGKRRFCFNRVVSYRFMADICVELEEEF